MINKESKIIKKMKAYLLNNTDEYIRLHGKHFATNESDKLKSFLRGY